MNLFAFADRPCHVIVCTAGADGGVMHLLAGSKVEGLEDPLVLEEEVVLGPGGQHLHATELLLSPAPNTGIRSLPTHLSARQ